MTQKLDKMIKNHRKMVRDLKRRMRKAGISKQVVDNFHRCEYD